MSERRRLAGDVGLETEDGFHRLLRRGAKLPARAKVTLRTAENGQGSLEFTVIQRLGPRWSAAFRQARIDGLPDRPRGKVKIRLSLAVDPEGILVASVKVPRRRGTTRIATGHVSVATASSLDRALRAGEGIGLVERGLMPSAETATPPNPLVHRCEGCGESIRFRAISLLAPPVEGFTCEACGNLRLVPSLDNMLASFFRDVPGGRIAPVTPAAAVESDRLEGHREAIRRAEEALAPCPCGSRFRLLAPASCPECETPFVTYDDDLLFRLQQVHLPVVEDREILGPLAASPWSREHLEPYLEDLRTGRLERRGDYLLLPLTFRNRGGWLVIPIGYALVLATEDGRGLHAFRPFGEGEGAPAPATPEQWQARQNEADAAFVEEVEAALGVTPLLSIVPPDGEVEGTAVFPVTEEVEGPVTLVVARAVERRLPL